MGKKIYITPETVDQYAIHRDPAERTICDAMTVRELRIFAGDYDDQDLVEQEVLYDAAVILFGPERAKALYDIAFDAATISRPRVIQASAVLHPAFLSPRVEKERITPHWTYDDPDYAAWAEETFIDPGYDLSLFPYPVDGAEAGTSSGLELTYLDIMRLAYTDDFAVDGAKAGTRPGGGQAGTFANDGAGAGTSAEPTAKPSAEGRWAGTSPTERRQAPWPRGPKAGTSLSDSGREAGVFWELLPQTVADGWKAGRHDRRDGGGAGTPLEAAGHIHNDGAGAGTPWHPLDDVAVDGRQAGSAYGSYDDKQQGRFIARLLARKRGR